MLISETILAPLRAASIFDGLEEAQITAIAAIAERVLYKPGDTIVAPGASADSAILIVWGEALSVSLLEPEKVVDVHAGTMLSEMAMFVEIEAGTAVVARSAVRALRLPREDMLAVLADDPDIADHLVQRVAGRLRSVFEALDGIETEFSRALDLAEIRSAVGVSGITGSHPGVAPATH